MATMKLVKAIEVPLALLGLNSTAKLKLRSCPEEKKPTRNIKIQTPGPERLWL